MPESYQKPTSCNKFSGSFDDIEREICRANGHYWNRNAENSINDPLGTSLNDGVPQGETFCDFTQVDEDDKPYDKCRLLAQEGFAYNLYECRDKENFRAVCANNCRGVDPNAVVVGGSAVLAATAIAAVGSLSSLFPVVFGLGTVALAGGGLVANGMCPIGFCNVC